MRNRGLITRKIADLECNRLKEIKLDRKWSKPRIADHQLSIARGKQCLADEGSEASPKPTPARVRKGKQGFTKIQKRSPSDHLDTTLTKWCNFTGQVQTGGRTVTAKRIEMS